MPELLLPVWLLLNTSVIRRNRTFFSLLTTSLGLPRLDPRYATPNRFVIIFRCHQQIMILFTYTHLASEYLCHCPLGACSVGPYPLCCGLPAHTGHWYGDNAGENYHYQKGLHHVSTSETTQDANCTSAYSHVSWLFILKLLILLQAIYVPADDLTDPGPATTFAHWYATNGC